MKTPHKYDVVSDYKNKRTKNKCAESKNDVTDDPKLMPLVHQTVSWTDIDQLSDHVIGVSATLESKFEESTISDLEAKSFRGRWLYNISELTQKEKDDSDCGIYIRRGAIISLRVTLGSGKFVSTAICKYTVPVIYKIMQ